MAPRETWVGRTYPLGATFDGYGTNFAVFSRVGESVDLCLFDRDRHEERITLHRGEGHVWNAYLPGVGPGQYYGFRVHGPWAPSAGVRCNPHKLLLDPYAKSTAGSLSWGQALFGHKFDAPDQRNDEDSAPTMLKGVVVDQWFDWQNDRKLSTPWHDTVIYEVHVKGFTERHPDIPEELRGTYLGLAHPAAIDHLLKLGVTAVELLPIHQFLHDGRLLDRGMRNYWGYNTIGFFAPHDEYASRRTIGAALSEFKQMVRTLHQAGLEVILDVVYNHTAEGNHLGPTLSFKGFDNQEYYRLTSEQPFYYYDTTGTGNSMHVRQPFVLQLIMDSLRYWVQEIHVDGFRFDLAASLARELQEVDRLSTFLQLVHQDPVLRTVKLIAEPWDLGPGGYAAGEFPPVWSEWNGKFRDGVRDLWRGREGSLQDFGARFTGSADLYQQDGARQPSASINFVAVHDGFTLRDLVSYESKHNEANGEDNRDGSDDNRSWNCGAEGETSDAAVLALRARQQRNLLATLFLSQGVPMLQGGDEIGRTQRGNNNGYCQDNELSWFDWEKADQGLLTFTSKLVAFYRKHPTFRRRGWFQSAKDIVWTRPDGNDMGNDDWHTGRAVGVFLDGEGLVARDQRGKRIVDDSFFVAINASHERVEFSIPPRLGTQWEKVFDTESGFHEIPATLAPTRALAPRSLAVFRRTAA
jgi:isoamylase